MDFVFICQDGVDGTRVCMWLMINAFFWESAKFHFIKKNSVLWIFIYNLSILEHLTDDLAFENNTQKASVTVSSYPGKNFYPWCGNCFIQMGEEKWHFIYEKIFFLMNHVFIPSLNIKKSLIFWVDETAPSLNVPTFFPFLPDCLPASNKRQLKHYTAVQDLYGIQIPRTKCCPPPTDPAQICILSFARISLT